MELLSVIVALETLKKEGSEVVVYSDSKYVVEAVEKGWVFGWEKKGLLEKATLTGGRPKKQKKNVDLWQLLEQETVRHRIIWHWVKAHSGIRGNEMADQLANQAIDIEAIN